ncbi:ABC-F family ATP-binding cassette domain-containing protein [Shewanella baltica]|uniref:ABC-F family ATP-binding cassette domain-containing protein n=1 Tax=Shewanella baltica TaxID=62322 RepID=UPI00217E8C91|nr:ABC-F family ATP-binding cassette domain-containing protein [Shewanella baltica]MCS6095975.1 ABC-F family ATP-binding cassette domain-containing protein [Shewanella baltica]MCS6227016.1 ABC-F family ATP-binding cassette domain-containing protein [Shewanella baltica]
MSLLKVHNLTYHIGDKTLYQNADFNLFPAEHVGVTGSNGVGKSTLLKLLQIQLLPDGGDIIWQPSVKVGYLDQHAQMDAQFRVRDYLKTAFSELYLLEAEMMAIYACAEKSADDSYLVRAADIQTQLESQSFYQVDNHIDAVADGLGITQFGMHTRLGELSGGQRHKVMLASLLLMSPDVLLLDEPTNYLDSVHIQWLADYLTDFNGAFMVVSHDHAFLNRIATSICDIDRQQIRKYKGNIDKAMAQKVSDGAAHAKQYLAQKKHIDKLEQFIAKNGAGVNASIANARKKQLTRITKLAAPELDKPISIAFKHTTNNAQQVLSATDLLIGYSRPLLPTIALNISRGEKVLITGFNGIGKSTLLKTLVGELAPVAGQIAISTGVKLGYFEQELHWPYPDATAANLIKSACGGLDDKAVRQQLAQFGVSGKLAMQPIRTLSGGEQTKVKLCRLAQNPTNLLVLDEPTTHLDVTVKAALKQALIEYSGTIIVVSHERSFVADWPDRIVDIQAIITAQDAEII